MGEQNLNHVVAEFAQETVPGVPKHVRLRNAVLAAIRKGHLKAGDQLPPEQELSKAVGLSLGTVQRALSNLASERALIREQGRGTFIARTMAPDDLWQFRFVAAYGEDPLPVSLVLLDRQIVTERGPWLDVLGHDERGYCQLRRLIVVNKDYRCVSRFYVRISRFPKIMKIAPSKLTGNLKRVLADEFGAVTHAIEQFAMAGRTDDEDRSLLKIDARSPGMAINSVGRTIGREAISFQSVWVPAGKYYLELLSGARPNG
jgi:DNA-binding GntR family transcriptional regulator